MLLVLCDMLISPCVVLVVAVMSAAPAMCDKRHGSLLCFFFFLFCLFFPCAGAVAHSPLFLSGRSVFTQVPRTRLLVCIAEGATQTMKGYWFDPATNRYYKLDREHREAAKERAAQARREAERGRSAAPATFSTTAAPLHRPNIALSVLRSQLGCPSSGPLVRRALYAADLAHQSASDAAHTDVLAGWSLATDAHRLPLCSLCPRQPLLAVAGRAPDRSLAAGFLHADSGAFQRTDTQLQLAGPDCTSVFEFSPSGALFVLHDAAAKHLVVERVPGPQHKQQGRVEADAWQSAVVSRCRSRDFYWAAQWHPHAPHLIALGGTLGSAYLYNVERAQFCRVLQDAKRRRPGALPADVMAVSWSRGTAPTQTTTSTATTAASHEEWFELFCGRRSGAVQRCDLRMSPAANGSSAPVAMLGSSVHQVRPLACMDSTAFVASSAAGGVALYDLRSTAPVSVPALRLTAEAPRAAAAGASTSFVVAPGERGAVVRCVDGSVRCWSLTDGAPLALLSPPAPTGTEPLPARLLGQPTGTVLYCASDGSCLMWQLPPGL